MRIVRTKQKNTASAKHFHFQRRVEVVDGSPDAERQGMRRAGAQHPVVELQQGFQSVRGKVVENPFHSTAKRTRRR